MQAVSPRGIETSTTVGVDPVRRPAEVTLLGLILLQGVTAMAGGAAMVFGALAPEAVAMELAPPIAWLNGLPFDSWLVPGLVLGVGLGAGALVVGWGLARRPDWAWLAWTERWTRYYWAWTGAVALGAGLTTWIAVQLLLLPEPSWLQAIYGPLGIVIVGLSLLPSVRERFRMSRQGEHA